MCVSRVTKAGVDSMAKRTKKPKVEKKKDPKPVKVMSDELERLKECEDLVKRIELCEALCDERAVRVEQARTDLKEIKGSYNAAVIELRRLCRARKEKHPLFDQAKPEEKAPEAKPEPVAVVPVQIEIEVAGENPVDVPVGWLGPVSEVLPGGVAIMVDGERRELADDEFKVLAGDLAAARSPKVETPAPVASDAWKSEPLSAAGINGNIGRLLEEHGHDTLGKLAKLMNDHGQWWNKEVKGLGEQSAAKVADSFAEFWRNHPEYCGAA